MPCPIQPCDPDKYRVCWLYQNDPVYRDYWDGHKVTVTNIGPLPLGNYIHNALELVGVTPERVSRWLGQECNCKERQDKMNQIGAWASRVIGGNVSGAVKYLKRIMGEEQ
jgi:hypothetical protein